MKRIPTFPEETKKGSFYDIIGRRVKDMLEGKGPAEGYALKSCEVKVSTAGR